jgi:hypothetical protein
LRQIGLALTSTGLLTGFDLPLPQYTSAFHRLVSTDGINIWFSGASAFAVYGGPVPIFVDDPFALEETSAPAGDEPPSIGSGGGERWFISNLDWAILADLGLPVRGSQPICAADFNQDALVNPDDLSEFITCFFLALQFPGVCPPSDFNADTLLNPDDLSEFISTFFLTIPSGC